jgi:penicillin-binding protein 1A
MMVLVSIGLLLGLYKITSIPLPTDVHLPQEAIVYDRDGRTIGSYSDVRRIVIDTSALPSHISQAVLAAEDRGFYEHGGVSFPAIIRASLANLRSGSIVQGGSTITQQYVKNAFLHDPSRTIVRKVKEAVLAVKLEDHLSKDQILDSYLNTIYLGRGAYGIEAAARTYFDKHADRLTLSEAAFLAGIIRSPERLQPGRNDEGARTRRDDVLRAMADEGYIGAGRLQVALAAPVTIASGIDERASRVKAAYFMEWLRRDLRAEFGDCLFTCGLRIHTTLDLDIQRDAERAVSRALRRREDPQAALVAMTPTGEVLAFVGGRAFTSYVAASGFDLAADLPGRQAGSALKPFTLLAALEAGLSPTSVFSGASPWLTHDADCAGARGEPWKVGNYGNRSHGSMSLATATALSVNTVYAQVAQRIGPGKIADVLDRFRFDRRDSQAERVIEPFCALSLGALDVTPLEMARAYAGLASGGILPQVSPVAYVEDAQGRCLKVYSPAIDIECEESAIARGERVADEAQVEQVTSVLRGVLEGGTGVGARLGEPAAGKTGTSQNNVDAWFAGYTDRLAASVWLGYPAERDGKLVPQMRRCSNSKRCRPVRGIDVAGGTLPATIWGDFMRDALKHLEAQEEGKTASEPGVGGAPSEAPPPAPRPTRTRRPEPATSPEPQPSTTPRRLIVLPTPLPTPP